MRIKPLTVKDKLGRTVVFRAAMPEDAADIIQYRNQSGSDLRRTGK